jgi:hypothetical protein
MEPKSISSWCLFPFLVTHEQSTDHSFFSYALSFLFFRIRFIHIHLPWIPQRAPNIASSNSLNIHPEAKELLLPSAFDSHQQETRPLPAGHQLNILCGHQYCCPDLPFLLHSWAVTIHLIVHFIFFIKCQEEKMEQLTTMDNNNPSRQAVPFSPLLIPLQQPCSENTNTSCPLNNHKYLSTLFP